MSKLALSALLLLAVPALSQPPIPADSGVSRIGIGVGVGALPISSDSAQQPRRRAIQVSEWYARRLTIHKIGSYAMLPLFGAQYLAGRELYDKGSAAPSWAKTTHRVGATALSGVFTANTVTGLWNLWDSRAVEDRRKLRYAHALSMLAADAGFTYAGVKLSEDAETSGDKRKLHRTIALSSMGVSIASGVMMKVWNK
jgi:hypothetical protein